MLLQNLVDAQMAFKKAQSLYANSLLRMGEYHVRNGEYDDALIALKESLVENRSVCSAVGSGAVNTSASGESGSSIMPSITEISDYGDESLISGLSSSHTTSAASHLSAGSSSTAMHTAVPYLSSASSVAAGDNNTQVSSSAATSTSAKSSATHITASSAILSTPEGMSIHQSSLNDMITTLSNLGKVYSLRGEERDAVRYYDEKTHVQAWISGDAKQSSANATSVAESSAHATANAISSIEATCGLGSPAVFFSEGHANNIMSEINEDVKALDELFRGISFRKDKTVAATEATSNDEAKSTVQTDAAPMEEDKSSQAMDEFSDGSSRSSPSIKSKKSSNDIHSRRRVRTAERESCSSPLPPIRQPRAEQQLPQQQMEKDDNELADAIDTYRTVIDSQCVGRVGSERHEKKYAEFLRRSKSLAITVDSSKHQRKEWQLALEIYEASLLAQKEASRTVPFPPGTPRKRTASDFAQDAHTGVASTMIAMGGIYYKLNCVQDELHMYNEALSVYQEMLGRNHPHVAGTMKNIGMVLAEQGQFDEAMEKFYEARRIYEVVKDGKDNVSCCDVASVLSCMGNVQNRRGDLEDALRLYEEALVIYKKVSSRARELGGRSRLAIQEVASTLKIMGMVHTKREELDKAMGCFQDAIDIMRQNFNEKGSGPVVTSILSRIGGIFCKIGKFDEAMSHYQEAYDLATRTFGTTDHPEVAQVLHYIGGIHQKLGDLTEAMSCYKNAAKIYQCTLGRDDPTVATTLVCIGSLHYTEKNLDGAMNYYTEALRLNRSAYGTRHPDVIPTMKSIALIHAKRENFDSAIGIFTEVLKIKYAELGDMHPEVASCYKRIGNVHYQRGDLVSAEKDYRQALSIYQHTLGDEHQSTKSARAVVEKINKEIADKRQSSSSPPPGSFFKRAPKGYESL